MSAAGDGGQFGYQQLVAGAIVLIFGAFIVSQLAFAGTTPITTNARFDGGNDGELNPAARNITSTTDTLGTKLSLDGNDSQLSADISSPGPGDAELCTMTTIRNTGENATIATAGGELTLEYHGNRSTPQWVGSRYDPGDRDAADTTTGVSDAANQTHLCVRQTGDTLTLAVDASDQSSATMGSGLDTSLANTSALDGTVEETRSFSEALSSSQRSTLQSTPTAPVDTGNTTARLYYDDRGQVGQSVSGFPIYYEQTTATVTNGTLVAGAGGRGATTDDLSRSVSGRSVDRVSGSNLQNQPVAYLSYQSAGVGGGLAVTVLTTLQAAFVLAPVVLVVYIAGRIIGIVPSLGVLSS